MLTWVREGFQQFNYLWGCGVVTIVGIVTIVSIVTILTIVVTIVDPIQ